MPEFRSGELVTWSLGYLRPFRPALLVVTALSLAEVGLRALNPWALKGLVDYAIVGVPMPGALSRVVTPIAGEDRLTLLVMFAAASGAIQFVHQLVLMHHGRRQSHIAQHVVHRLRRHLFAHLQALALAHHTRTPTGASVYHLSSDAACLEQLIFRGIFPVAFSALTLVVMFGTLARVEPLLALCAVSVVPALYAAVKVNAGAMSARVDRVKLSESEVSGHLHETLSGIALTKSFAREPYEIRRFSDRASKAVDARLDLALHETRFAFSVGMVSAAGQVITLGVGGWRVLNGDMTVGSLLVVLAYLGFVYGPMSVIANTAGTLESALVSVRRVRRTLELPPEASSDGVRPGPARGEVRFRGVSFRYGDRTVLRDVTFTASPGEMVALVGPSGAGKTTLVGLINRFHDPNRGRVMIDGIDVHRYALDALRTQVAVVLQEAVLISGTVLENIRYGRLDATDEEVEAAARAAHADGFIRQLPMGYATEMEKAGTTLSGGQRQRLSIARAFLKDSPVLILDEPTSALDPVSERLILEAIQRLRVNRTTFVIAHRLSTVQDADRILLLDAGRIVDEGRHEALLESSALYREMAQGFQTRRPGAPDQTRS